MGFSAVNLVRDDVVITPPFMPDLSVKEFGEAMKLEVLSPLRVWHMR